MVKPLSAGVFYNMKPEALLLQRVHYYEYKMWYHKLGQAYSRIY